ncbi:uncharacterized protein KQ657_004507 [Scheffersomyces spartinae]|uniref:WD40 repeat-like protein n=1 Tax=Scheffersomyces spartinae TaxID=45513 RepID=A0A9P7VC68_9ASCO|nr:uncharacterized protein KQ657_004507 [Scheffersomyces spartinae]KAG7194826.1 hypothetical protein KQ657_004507 [Scheffersomyces spartinae]
MEWYTRSSQRTSGSNVGATPHSNGVFSQPSSATGAYSMNSSTTSPLPLNDTSYNSMTPGVPDWSGSGGGESTYFAPAYERSSYFYANTPLYCCDWTTIRLASDLDCIALGSYKEGFSNRIQVLHGLPFGSEMLEDIDLDGTSDYDYEGIQGFDFRKAAEINVDYPVTKLQWDPQLQKGNVGPSMLAASSEVLRIYKVEQNHLDPNADYKMVQEYTLANHISGSGHNKRFNNNNNNDNNSNNNSTGGGKSPTSKDVVHTYPPVTSFDWNSVNLNIIITSSVDTTCTVWDLNRPYGTDNGMTNTASVKTQLIAHDSEVFDVKFLHKSTDLFASVGNDGSMRIFDLRSLEHLTIIYEPPHTASGHLKTPGTPSLKVDNSQMVNPKALLKLSASNIDQHYLATVGVNSNKVILIDIRMPGIPCAVIDGSIRGTSNAAINSISWHPKYNFLLTGGDDCQALLWDCNNLELKLPRTTTSQSGGNNGSNVNGLNTSGSGSSGTTTTSIDTPVMAYSEELEVNNVTWRGERGDWIGVISGKGFQGVKI